MDDVVDRPGRLGDDLDAVDAIDQRLEHRGGLQPCETLTGTCVCAVAEPDVTSGVVADVEDVGAVPFAFVTVGRGVEHQHPGAGRNRHAGNDVLLQSFPRECTQRRFVPDHFVDGVRDERGVALEQRPLLWVFGEQVDGAGDGTDRGVERRGDVVDEQRRHFLGGEIALVDRCQ